MAADVVLDRTKCNVIGAPSWAPLEVITLNSISYGPSATNGGFDQRQLPLLAVVSGSEHWPVPRSLTGAPAWRSLAFARSAVELTQPLRFRAMFQAPPHWFVKAQEVPGWS